MAFDELHDGKMIRPIYRKYFHDYSRRTLQERNRADRLARACVNRDANFLPLARLLSAREYHNLSLAVKQRGRAIRMFLHDHYFGNQTYLRAKILSKAQIESIRKRYPLSPHQTKLRPENIQFWYAPDIIRDDKGVFRVIEDNIGFVGGMGDLGAFADALKALGAPLTYSHQPRSFYRAMVSDYRREARMAGGGKIVLLSHPQSERPIQEDQRLAQALKPFKVTRVTNLLALQVREEGMYHRGERVGFVIINMDWEEIEPLKAAADRVTDFWKAASAGKFGISYAPGLEFAGDKELCPHVERFVQFYLNQKCLLRSLKTISFSKTRDLQTVSKYREGWVIKLARGQSGESVWIGRHTKPLTWAKLINRVKRKSNDFIAQEYCEPSQFLGHDVDLRPLAVINLHDERVSPIPWGRAARDKNLKTNISRGGYLSAIGIVPARKR